MNWAAALRAGGQQGRVLGGNHGGEESPLSSLGALIGVFLWKTAVPIKQPMSTVNTSVGFYCAGSRFMRMEKDEPGKQNN